ncbi:MAG: carbohydrate binding domain-containing protein [Chloroflexota bacterium]|jgi:hypothetical protein
MEYKQQSQKLPTSERLLCGRLPCRSVVTTLMFLALWVAIWGQTDGRLNQVLAISDATLEIVSKSSTGVLGNGPSRNPSISADGHYVAFESSANNLVSNDTNGVSDIFVHDRQTGQTTRVSLTHNGDQANGDSTEAAISGDGRFVSYSSRATNLVANPVLPPEIDCGDTSGHERNPSIQVYLYDRQTGAVIQASVNNQGVSANCRSWISDISGDGTYIVYGSHATNLVDPPKNNKKRDTYIYNRLTGEVRYANLTPLGTRPNEGAGLVAISSDGRFVTFNSRSTLFDPIDDSKAFDVILLDQQTSQTTLVSLNETGGVGQYDSQYSDVSTYGKFVVYQSDSQLTSDDRNSVRDIYLRDVANNRTILITSPNSGQQANGSSRFGKLSGDGRYVTFISSANNLVANDTNGTEDLFVRDMTNGQISRLSVTLDGVQSNGNVNGTHAISTNGAFVAFSSSANTLVTGDKNGKPDIFVRSLDLTQPLPTTTPTIAGTPLPTPTATPPASATPGPSATPRPTATPDPSVCEFSEGNLIRNPGFELNSSDWKFYSNVSGNKNEAVTASDWTCGRFDRVTITRTGSNIQLFQPSLAIQKDQQYTLRFDARADSSRAIKVFLHLNKSPNTNLGLSQTAKLTTNWQTFEFTFTATGSTTDARLRIWLANQAAGSQFSFDNFSLTAAP